MADTFKDAAAKIAHKVAMQQEPRSDARDACYAIEKAIRALRPPAPAQDEREALIATIKRRYASQMATGLQLPSDVLADAILAAGFKREGR